MTRAEALALLQKWSVEQTRLNVGVIQDLKQIFVFSASGRISQFEPHYFVISEHKMVFILKLEPDFSFEYVDPREAFPEMRENIERQAEGALIIIPNRDTWRCTIVELKESGEEAAS